MDSSLTGGHFEIVVAVEPEPRWTAWFEDFEIESEAGRTRLIGQLADQAALHGALARLRDLAIPIIAVNHLPDEGAPGDAGADGDRNTPPGT